MQKALYDPIDGYYQSDRPKWGLEGDFITAPELTPLFGQSLAIQCMQILPELEKPVLFELGAGSGQLCIDILTYLEQHDALPEAYWILEISAALQAQQKEKIAKQLPHLVDSVHWLSAWPEKPYEGIIIANEVLDAMPVHRFILDDAGILEQYVQLVNDRWVWHNEPCQNPLLREYLQKVLPSDLPRPYMSEANLWVDGWLASAAESLRKGVFLILDYGFPRHEFYHPDRSQGTLMCHYKNQAHPDPLIHVGMQDITAHVDFTQVAEAARKAGFDIAGYTTQAAFLMNNGLLALLEKNLTLETQQAVKILLHPHEMGELFKVLALTKQVTIALNGTSRYERVLL